MELWINGEQGEWEGIRSLDELLECLHIPPGQVASVVDGELVPRSKRQAYWLQEGQRVELFQFIGGG